MATQPDTLTPEELYSMERTGQHLLERGKFDDAQQLFAGLITLAPSSWYAYHALGTIARERKDLVRSVSYFKHAEQLARATTFEPTMALAEAHILQGQAAEARGAIARVVQATGANEALHQRARALMRTLDR